MLATVIEREKKSCAKKKEKEKSTFFHFFLKKVLTLKKTSACLFLENRGELALFEKTKKQKNGD